MKSVSGTAAAIVLTLSACAGSRNSYTGVSSGPISRTMECAVAALSDEGFFIQSRDNDAGILTANNGPATIELRVIPGGARNTFIFRVDTSVEDVAKEAAEEIVVECGTG